MANSLQLSLPQPDYESPGRSPVSLNTFVLNCLTDPGNPD